jgi:hypothetical protein
MITTIFITTRTMYYGCLLLSILQITLAFSTTSTRTSTSNTFKNAYKIQPNKSNMIPKSYTHYNQKSSLPMVGDFFSGLTGQPPKSLNVPLDSILTGTNIDPSRDNVDLQCVYKASRDGWSAIDFHNNCDGRGSGLVVVLSQSGKKFGGFNPLGWQSNDDYGTTTSAFLWYLKGGGKGREVIKCPVLSGGNAAIFDYASGGPQFGSADLIIGKPEAAVMGGFAGPDAEDITKSAGDLRRGSVFFGGAYTGPSFPIGGSFKVVEVEVYCNGNITPIKNGGFKLWPF